MDFWCSGQRDSCNVGFTATEIISTAQFSAHRYGCVAVLFFKYRVSLHPFRLSFLLRHYSISFAKLLSFFSRTQLSKPSTFLCPSSSRRLKAFFVLISQSNLYNAIHRISLSMTSQTKFRIRTMHGHIMTYFPSLPSFLACSCVVVFPSN